MTSCKTLTANALEISEAVDAVANKLFDQQARIEYTFVFFVEDAQHGGDKVGTKPISCKFSALLADKKEMYVLLPKAAECEKALVGGTLATLRCQLLVSLCDIDESCGHRSRLFQSYEFEQDPDDKYLYHVTIDDTTPRTLDTESLPWEFSFRSAKRKEFSVQSLTFTHNPSYHEDLWRAMRLEAMPTFREMARALVTTCVPQHVVNHSGEVFPGTVLQ